MEPLANQRIVIKGTKGFRQVEVQAISHIFCEDYVCILHLISNEPVTCSKSLRYFEQILPIGMFCRIHQNAIVNLMQVETVRYTGRHRLAIMKDGTTLAISVRKWPAFRDAFQKHTLTDGNGTLTGKTDTPTRQTDTPADRED